MPRAHSTPGRNRYQTSDIARIVGDTQSNRPTVASVHIAWRDAGEILQSTGFALYTTTQNLRPPPEKRKRTGEAAEHAACIKVQTRTVTNLPHEIQHRIPQRDRERNRRRQRRSDDRGRGRENAQTKAQQVSHATKTTSPKQENWRPPPHSDRRSVTRHGPLTETQLYGDLTHHGPHLPSSRTNRRANQTCNIVKYSITLEVVGTLEDRQRHRNRQFAQGRLVGSNVRFHNTVPKLTANPSGLTGHPHNSRKVALFCASVLLLLYRPVLGEDSNSSAYLASIRIKAAEHVSIAMCNERRPS